MRAAKSEVSLCTTKMSLRLRIHNSVWRLHANSINLHQRLHRGDELGDIRDLLHRESSGGDSENVIEERRRRIRGALQHVRRHIKHLHARAAKPHKYSIRVIRA